ncbi:amino acid ABC transporter substrate-binding protein, PAAT family [Brevibacterium sp. 239c]|uniref:glutamate ABC transporter substrate-binding protein n=1 Tax=Brevibacterium sp. 239c TaxID=1965356 RepID=UPI000C5A3828|nr:glutamate ABC transporter substrate-binding protein [Brevibacterium sp. 239c]SMY03387.1 amino acid ABC transporter substrate-binding protein, PAAT family [Brevibacterium sp. 239c]
MKKLRLSIASVAIGLLALSGCGQGGTPDAPAEGDGDQAKAPEYTVNDSADFKDSKTWKAAKDAGKLKIGVKYDQPGLGNVKAGTKEPAGFDIEIAKMVAAQLGFSPDQIKYTETVSANREPFLQQGNVDMIVATYTINDERKKVVDFAGPYYIAGQDLLVAKDSDIAGPDDLDGKKVCSVDGSTPAQNIEEKYTKAELVAYDTYSKCVTDLQSGSVDAVTTDDAILRGYAKQYEGEFKVVGKPFTEEPYGVGLPKGDDAMRDAVNDALQKGMDDGDWKKAFEYTLGSTDDVDMPKIDRY